MDTHQPHPLPESNSGKFFQLNSELAERFLNLLEHQDEMKANDTSLELIMLDYKGTTFPLERPQFTTLISKLITHPKSKFRIITLDAANILNHSPRFLHLRDACGGKIDWRIATNQDPSKIQMSFAILNAKTLIKKPVRDAYHGYQSNDMTDIRASIDYFEQIWQLSEYAPPSQPLGI